jgi:hypothetical protein
MGVRMLLTVCLLGRQWRCMPYPGGRPSAVKKRQDFATHIHHVHSWVFREQDALPERTSVLSHDGEGTPVQNRPP